MLRRGEEGGLIWLFEVDVIFDGKKLGEFPLINA